MNNDFRRLNISVHEFLVKIGIPMHIRGYKMIKYLLIEILKNYNYNYKKIKFGDLYKIVSEKFGVGRSSIEKNIRDAVRIASERCDGKIWFKYFGKSNIGSRYKPTNREFIEFACEYLRVYGDYLFDDN